MAGEGGLADIIVLDFDLSWHKDATEASVLHFASASGFLVPEQVRRTSSAATRSAAVDSFGIGMTLYFLRTGQEPFSSQHQHRSWAVGPRHVRKTIC